MIHKGKQGMTNTASRMKIPRVIHGGAVHPLGTLPRAHHAFRDPRKYFNFFKTRRKE
jgi:hypothetical protein